MGLDQPSPNIQLELRIQVHSIKKNFIFITKLNIGKSFKNPKKKNRKKERKIPEYPFGREIVVPCSFLPLKCDSSTANPSISIPTSHETQKDKKKKSLPCITFNYNKHT